MQHYTRENHSLDCARQCIKMKALSTSEEIHVVAPTFGAIAGPRGIRLVQWVFDRVWGQNSVGCLALFFCVD